MRTVLLTAVGCLLLAACGGGGNRASTTPPPPPPPPPSPPPSPTNSLITDLRASQTFTGDATTTAVTISTADGVVNGTSANRAAVSIRYDAAAQSYTVETQGRSETFTPANMQPERFPGERAYAKSGAISSYLTLVTTPYYAATATNRYVGMGYWQQNNVSNGIQTTQFSTFTYGLDTSAAAMPRTGSAHWKTDIFGLLTQPNVELRTIQGEGRFDVDFAGGVFSTSANVDEYDFVTGGGRVGSLRFQGAGQLTSGNGFNGNFSYNNNLTALGGTIAGRFYGPGAEEIGAAFEAQGNGAVLTGAMTGQRTDKAGAPQTLLHVEQEQRLTSYAATFFTQAREGEAGFADVKALSGDAFVTISPQGVKQVSLGSFAYSPSTADLVPNERANFTTYRAQLGEQPLQVDFYKVGSANTELALTYTSFAAWSTKRNDAAASGQKIVNTDIRHILYGLETPRDLLAARTGTATYAGVVYGNGASLDGMLYSIGGTSRFNVDFSGGRYSGALDLTGTTAGVSITNFGSFGFASTIGYGQMLRASFDNGANADPFHVIQPYFFGPDGQEIGATFNLATGSKRDTQTVLMSGVTVAKRQ
ncbi:hypothetical protein [Sphingosinicella sp. LY1275]|uniref:hypothetical protein n=1 Tax=Sphingosinicella sp. LY1275 TaxID=3095379 RepID=UPI002ADED8BE|nr:hypothetical protein [Sphingosinicella sp. LY1275]MEA1013730.1 hypothetical protein [Sphingosinicella sp. LY1275]